MFNTDTHGPWTVFHPSGEIDIATTDEFRETLLDALERARMVAVDFSEVTFMDSSGISVIVAGIKHTRDHGGRLVLVALTKRVRFVLNVTGMDQTVEIGPSVDSLDVGLAAS
jgi:anti-sigma B factor antagonist